MKIVLTRELGKNDALWTWLPDHATVQEVPLTSTRYFDERAVNDDLHASEHYGKFCSLVVTSERSMTYVPLAIDASSADVEVYCVGPTTSEALRAQGVKVRAQGDGGAATLANQISRGPVLLIGAESMRDELTLTLRANGLDVTVVACYETLALELDEADVAKIGDADVVFIGAPSAWSVARDFVNADSVVVVPGASTGAVVQIDHAKIIEGWGPTLRTRLDTA